MVTFSDTGYVVEVQTGSDPAENYVQAMNSIVELLQDQAPELRNENYHLLELLKAMMPTKEQAAVLITAAA